MNDLCFFVFRSLLLLNTLDTTKYNVITRSTAKDINARHYCFLLNLHTQERYLSQDAMLTLRHNLKNIFQTSIAYP